MYFQHVVENIFEKYQAVCEIVMKIQLYEYFKYSHIFGPLQFGYVGNSWGQFKRIIWTYLYSNVTLKKCIERLRHF